MAVCNGKHLALIGAITLAAPGAMPTPNRSVYDILRMPQWYPHADHVRNKNRIRNSLRPGACNCVGAPAALLAFNLAWATIRTIAGKSAVDAALAGIAPPLWFVAAPYAPPHSLPIIPPTLTRHPPIVPLNSLLGPNVNQSTWLGSITDVEGCPTLKWRVRRELTFCRNPHNSFWLALAHAMRGSGDYWGEIKAGTNNYYTQVAANPAHPRNMPYTILNAGIGARPAPNPNIAAQLAAAPTAEVAVELYQVIADAWRIELIVIQENAGNVGGTKTVIPTGDHNSRQIFLLAKQHGDWVALEPPFPGMDQFRYSWHMPFVYNSSPPNNPQLLRLAAELAASNLQRCPFMDAAGLPMPGYVLPPGGPEPPRPMVYEVYFAQPTPAQTMAYLNAGWW